MSRVERVLLPYCEGALGAAKPSRLVKDIRVDVSTSSARLNFDIESSLWAEEGQCQEVEAAKNSDQDKEPIPSLGLDQVACDQRSALSSDTEARCV